MPEQTNVVITLIGLGGELDSKVIEDVEVESEQVRTAVIELVQSVPFFSAGDKITIELCEPV